MLLMWSKTFLHIHSVHFIDKCLLLGCGTVSPLGGTHNSGFQAMITSAVKLQEEPSVLSKHHLCQQKSLMCL